MVFRGTDFSSDIKLCPFDGAQPPKESLSFASKHLCDAASVDILAFIGQHALSFRTGATRFPRLPSRRVEIARIGDDRGPQLAPLLRVLGWGR